MGDIVIIEKSDTVIPEKTVVVPATVERPTMVYNFEKPVTKGDFVRISVFLNESEISTLKYECTESADTNSELYPYLHFQVPTRIVTPKA